MKRPLRPDDVRKQVQKYASQPEPTEMDVGLRGVLTRYFNKIMGNENRRLVAGWLFAEEGQEFGELSFKSLTPQQVFALGKWVGSTKDKETGLWLTHPAWVPEAHSVLGAARYDYRKPEPLSMTEAALDLGGIITYEYETTTGEKSDESKDIPMRERERHSGVVG